MAAAGKPGLYRPQAAILSWRKKGRRCDFPQRLPCRPRSRRVLRRLFDAALAAAGAGQGACRRICRRRPRAAPSWSAPARPRPRWRARSRTIGRRDSRASSSRATAMACRAGASRWSRPAIPCPTPPARAAARRILAMRQRASARDDLVLCLISGGASALLALPAPGLDARRQARGDAGAAALGRDHRRDQLRAQASLGDQGRPARRRRRARARS